MWVSLKGTGSPVAHDDIVKVLEGVGKSYPCKTTFPDRVWIGAIQYMILEEITTTFHIWCCCQQWSQDNRNGCTHGGRERGLARGFGYENSRERRLVPSNAFDPIIVNRNSQIAAYITFTKDGIRWYSSDEIFLPRAGANDAMPETRRHAGNQRRWKGLPIWRCIPCPCLE